MRIGSRLGCLFFALVWVQTAYSQSTYYPLNPDLYSQIERIEIIRGKNAPDFHSTVKPYLRQNLRSLYKEALDDSLISASEKRNIWWLNIDNPDAPIDSLFRRRKSWLYRYPADAYYFKSKDATLHINPVVHWVAQSERVRTGASAQDNANPNPQLWNTRGFEFRGSIGSKIGFYSFLTTNQLYFPSWANRYIEFYQSVPQEGFWKRMDKDGRDFFTARGYVTAQLLPQVQLQFGHDRNFIGNGMRSMVLSDFSNNYTFLKLNTRVGRVNYQNLFAELKDVPALNPAGTGAGLQIPNKYLAFHHLSVNITPSLNIGLWESIIFDRGDSISRGFDLAYLNPVIFYRAVEQNLGSPDNALLGMDFRWNFLKHFQLYGQLVIDEFIYKNIMAGNGWWGNKQAGQLGLKYVNALGVRNLDLQAEFNTARPFTYSHEERRSNYAHYGLPLAHPLGANFREVIGSLHYRPQPKLQLSIRGFVARRGIDSSKSSRNFGSNIFRSYGDVKQVASRELNNWTGQGIRQNILFLDATLSYQVWHRIWLDLTMLYRHEKRAGQDYLRSIAPQFAIRYNVNRRHLEF